MPRSLPQDKVKVLCADGEVRNARINTKQDAASIAKTGFVSVNLVSVTGWIIPATGAATSNGTVVDFIFEPNPELRNARWLDSWQVIKDIEGYLMSDLSDEQMQDVLNARTTLADIYGPLRRLQEDAVRAQRGDLARYPRAFPAALREGDSGPTADTLGG